MWLIEKDLSKSKDVCLSSGRVSLPYVAICYDFLYNTTEYNHPYMRSHTNITRGVLIT